MILQHFAILQVVIPLIASPICILLRRSFLCWLLTLITSWIVLGISIYLFIKIGNEELLIYELGGWAAPWGIEYRIDYLNAFVLLILSMVAFFVVPFARQSVNKEISSDRHYLFYSMLLLCIAGLLGITITGDAFNLFVFLEISSLSSYVLISMGPDNRSLTAAYRYLILGTLGATFYIIGVGLMYMMTGTLNFVDLANLIPNLSNSKTIQAALAFLTVGLCLKIALFPLHMWLPSAYAFAPSVVTVFLAATATKVSVYALVRVVYSIFGGIDLFETLVVRDLLLVLSVMGMVAGSCVAIYQINVKRLLAYSSVAQIGYITLGIALNSVTGISAGLIHLLNHALIKGGLFMVMGCIMYRIGSVNLRDIQGLGRQMPITMGCFVAAGLALIGVPLSGGFISKWYLIQACLEKELWIVTFFIVLTSLLAVVYIWRVIEISYFRSSSTEQVKINEAPLTMLVPMILLIFTSYVFGTDSTLFMNMVSKASHSLLSVSR